MSRTHYIFVVLVNVLLLFIFSCKNHENKQVTAYTIPFSDFENILSIDGYTEPINSTTLACPLDVDGVVIYIVEDGTHVNEGEIVCIIEDQNLQNSYDQAAVDLENAEANLAKTQADLKLQYALLEAQVKNNEADTEIANLDSLQLIYSTPNQKRIKELELEKVGIEKTKYQKKLQALEVIQQSELKKIELEIQRLKIRVASTQERLETLTIKTPINGLATRGIYWMTGKKVQVGDPVWNRMPLVVIPDLSRMKVIIKAPERDYKSISINDSVNYSFDAMPNNIAYGKILRKSPVGQQISENSKVKYFEIEASIDSSLIMPEPGFTTNCHIVLKEVKDTIVIPQISVFEEDSIKVVYIKKKKGFEMRQVLTGISSPKDVIITAGLNRKETVSLIKPATSLVYEKTLLPVKSENPVTNTENKSDSTKTGSDKNTVPDEPGLIFFE